MYEQRKCLRGLQETVLSLSVDRCAPIKELLQTCLTLFVSQGSLQSPALFRICRAFYTQMPRVIHLRRWSDSSPCYPARSGHSTLYIGNPQQVTTWLALAVVSAAMLKTVLRVRWFWLLGALLFSHCSTVATRPRSSHHPFCGPADAH